MDLAGVDPKDVGPALHSRSSKENSTFLSSLHDKSLHDRARVGYNHLASSSLNTIEFHQVEVDDDPVTDGSILTAILVPSFEMKMIRPTDLGSCYFCFRSIWNYR